MDHRLKIKIQGGTRSGQRLCDTCHNGQIMRGDAESDEVVYCHYISEVVPLRVMECSNYQNKGMPQLHEMKAIAWMLRTDKGGHQIGFVSPQKWRAEKRERGDYDDDEL